MRPTQILVQQLAHRRPDICFMLVIFRPPYLLTVSLVFFLLRCFIHQHQLMRLKTVLFEKSKLLHISRVYHFTSTRGWLRDMNAYATYAFLSTREASDWTSGSNFPLNLVKRTLNSHLNFSEPLACRLRVNFWLPSPCSSASRSTPSEPVSSLLTQAAFKGCISQKVKRCLWTAVRGSLSSSPCLSAPRLPRSRRSAYTLRKPQSVGNKNDWVDQL